MAAKVCFISRMWKRKDNLFYALKNMVSPRQTYFDHIQANGSEPRRKAIQWGRRDPEIALSSNSELVKAIQGYTSITLYAEA